MEICLLRGLKGNKLSGSGHNPNRLLLEVKLLYRFLCLELSVFSFESENEIVDFSSHCERCNAT